MSGEVYTEAKVTLTWAHTCSWETEKFAANEMNLKQNLWVLHENTYRISVLWKLSELPPTRCREIQAPLLPHFIIQVPMSFAELNKASEVAAAHVPVPSSCSPHHGALWASLFPSCGGKQGSRQTRGEPNHPGKTQNCPITLCWVVCPAWCHFGKGSSTISPQPVAHKPGDLFLPPLSSAEWVIQILQHALGPLSQALSEWGDCTSPLTLPKRETLTVSYTEGELGRHISPAAAPPHFNPQREDCSYLSFILRTSNTSKRKD